MIGRRRILRAGCVSLATLAGHAPAQEAVLRGPLKIIVGLPPGGAADVIVRAHASVLETSLGQPVIVEHRPGGQFQISMQALMSAPADGHTLLYFYNGYASVHAVHKLFDLERQLAPITQVADIPIVLLVRGNAPFRTLADLIAWGREHPGRLTYGTLGSGGVEHLKIAQIEKAAGFKGVAVPYRGGPDMIKGLLGSEIDFGLAPGIFAKPYGAAGALRPLVVFQPQRWSDFPDLPTIVETSLPVAPLAFWGGYAARAGTPVPIVQRLYRELRAAATAPVVLERVAAAGAIPQVSPSPEGFGRVIAADIAWMTEAAKGLRLD